MKLLVPTLAIALVSAAIACGSTPHAPDQSTLADPAPPLKSSSAIEPQGEEPAKTRREDAKKVATGTRVLWANVHATEECFFFSGPFEHGRDATIGSMARLEIQGERVVLRLGDVAFEGVADHGSLEFVREDEREYRGKWKSTERIDARLSDEGLKGRYAYEECDLEGDQGCPSRCTIAADFVATGLVPDVVEP